MKKIELFFTIILVPVDYLALLLAAISAYAIRYTEFFAAYRSVVFKLPFNQYLAIATLVALVWLLIFALAGLYTIGGRKKKFDEFKKIILACSTGLAVVLAVMVFSRYLFESRFILLASWFFAIVFVLFFRLVVRLLQNILYRYGLGRKKIVIIGSNPGAQVVLKTLKQNSKLGFEVVANYNELTDEARQEIRARALRRNLDQVLFLKPEATLEEMHEVLDLADEHHIPFRYSADPFVSHAAGLEFDTLAGIPLVEIKRTRLEGWGRVYKRIFDIIGSILLIVLTSPIMFLATLFILLESGLPIFYRNERVGEHGKLFDVLKFRTMYQKYCIGKQFPRSPEALEFEQKLIAKRGIKEGPVYKIKDDPRIIRLGRFLRRLSIDELPQLFNVFIGQMSLVGPRPHQTREVEKYEKRHKRVLEIKPGITGMSQISGRSDLSFEEEVKLDTYYIEHWSLKLDLIILLKTPLIVLFGKGAY